MHVLQSLVLRFQIENKSDNRSVIAAELCALMERNIVKQRLDFVVVIADIFKAAKNCKLPGSFRKEPSRIVMPHFQRKYVTRPANPLQQR